MNGDCECRARLRNRDEAMFPRKWSGQRGGDHVEVEVERVDLDEPQPGVRRERLRDLRVNGEPEVGDGLFDADELEPCRSTDRFHLVWRQDLIKDQDLKQIGAVRSRLRRRSRTAASGRNRVC